MRATIVLVIYKENLEDSRSFQSLMANQAFLAAQGFNLVIYDNSPTPQALPTGQHAIAMQYRHDPSNPGLATAYNHALRQAQELGSEWLLLLDQDTRLDSDYFREVTELMGTVQADCVCLTPRISDGRRQISPMNSSAIRATPDGVETGYRQGHVTAINSGACWRSDWLIGIGGFNTDFPLDYLDHWAFHRALRDGKRIYVMTSQILQNLSISNRNQVSLARYDSIYESEYRFYSRYRTELFASYKRHLPIRLLKQLLLFKDKRVAGKTLELLLRKPPRT